jgi:hypothetical protein
MVLAMLHLSVTEGQGACVEHDAAIPHQDAISSVVHHAPVHDAHAGGGSAARTPPPPCDAPGQPSCCSLLAGCATIGLASQPAPTAPAVPAAAHAHGTPAEGSSSRRAAPEPPPPKR